MAHFYGTLTGSRGTATRCGTKNSGIMASAQSWNGSVTVTLMTGLDGDVEVHIQARADSGPGGRIVFSEKLVRLIEAQGLKIVD